MMEMRFLHFVRFAHCGRNDSKKIYISVNDLALRASRASECFNFF